ncbi:MAG: plastocyanin/azurin family copper-binding protein [Solirubrobacterales bacterium]
MRKGPLLTLMLVIAALALAGCGDDEGSGDTAQNAETTEQTGTAGAGDVTTVAEGENAEVELADFSIAPPDLSVGKGSTLDVTNVGDISHNLTVEQGPDPSEESKELAATDTFGNGESGTLEVDLDPGTYSLVCTISNHRQLGMVGTLTVR